MAISCLLSACDRAWNTFSPNVIVIVVDAARADHLGCYGYHRPTTPRIDRVVLGATVYTRAHTSAPWTLPAHASLFTGKDPFEHGAHRLYPDPQAQAINALHESQVTLAEVLADAGYATAAFAANDGYLAPRWQLDQGFQVFHAERAHAGVINTHVTKWLGTAEGPFFLFINYMDTHKPYNTTSWPEFIEPSDASRDDQALERLLKTVMTNRDPAPDDLVRAVIDQYDAALSAVDHQIGALLDTLASRGLYDDALIVITSDHGEAFGEHGLVTHGSDVYEELLCVPLVIKHPRQRKAARDNRLVSLSDVPRMIFSHLPRRVAAPYAGDFPNVPGNHPFIAENYHARTKHLAMAPVRTAIFDWPFKLIESTDGRSELYDLESDPGETNNRFRLEPETVRRLSMMLEAYRDDRGRFDEIVELPPLSREEIQKLKALGYIAR